MSVDQADRRQNEGGESVLCAIYCRLSKEDEDKQQPESESIQNQKSMLVKYAVERGWDIYNLYCDEDFSGADAHRPDFSRMLRDAEAGRFQIILCKSQSRFTRDMELVEKYIHGRFPQWGIRFVALADHVDTDVKGSKKARQINGLINEWYLEDLSENIRMVFDFKRRQGQYIGGFPLYGYRKDPADKNKLVVDETAAPVVRQIYRWSLEGCGAQRIAALLNRRGIDNPTRHKQKLGMNYVNGSGAGGGCWNKTAVSRILHNEMYAGVMVQGRKKKVSYKSKRTADVPEEQWYRVPGTHEAIIDPETFRQVQELLRPRRKADGRGEVHVLAGLVKCAECGSTMARTSNGQPGEKRVSYLRCSRSAAGGGRALCSRHSVRLDDLVELVSERLRTHLAGCWEPGDLQRFSPREQAADRVTALQKDLRTLEGQIEARAAALKTLYLDRVSGLLGEEEFCSMNREFQKERAHMIRHREELRREVERVNGAEDGGGAAERVRELLRLDPVPRELFVLAVEKVEVGEKDPETGRQEVRIHWKF
ncbi:recombinase family protein [Candidatus Pseudoscillospira sp. SGI.172]|uniref:recombinase family protein n=1 Tax=Candidatus Pseudoscillospira sp. SGI.172 TaxID=3420582 RepID=UPI002A778FE6|nr:recombinase family protein [Pseudoflavonifractor sp.]MDY3020306.1 recombinase family protein [Oscillospiraceae bacterium]